MDQDNTRDDELERLLGAPSADSSGDRTPVTVLTGFLGAGKTTLINRILSEAHGLRIAVLVNDFGDIDVDGELIVGLAAKKISLANGCVCCEVRDDLLAAIDLLMQSESDIDAILLEASGVAQPLTIASTFVDAARRGRVRLDGIVAVVDAEQLPDKVADPATADLIYGQLGCSDLVLLNKIDLADRQRVAAVRAFVCERLNGVRFIETVRADVPMSVLLGARPESPISSHDAIDHAHRSRFVSWVYQRERPFNEGTLSNCIAHLPASVYRIKGFIHASEHPQQRVLVQAVGMRGEITPFDEWGIEERVSRLVIIADRAIERRVVDAALDAC
ncbi:putative cobalamin synthesis protein [Mycobacterium bohemicum DSM 44277]|uniref:Putative cobalamin synthesis protein n=1 Tax=Mycobacterium bohemicum DSM 44277 TaxID=1236609 RepID=A0A0U0W490_MYCBE|nr:GTP-binding protein [Mycobacterium bohemicum]MCV6972060.1 GTP-binding protein [Mycobacterium bohemicum]CPR07068.1 putative cobalamin synthesis protein [Mycobacterium bohemicum DSM 44277]